MHPASSDDHDRAQLAAALRACAKGLRADEAACELIINHATWLHRRDFSDDFIHTGIIITDASTLMASIDWTAAITALDAGHLPCSDLLTELPDIVAVQEPERSCSKAPRRGNALIGRRYRP
jgi:hypothetical protein